MLKNTLLLSLLFFCLSCQKQEAKAKIHWKLQSHSNPTSIDFIELKKMSQNIAVMSEGRFLIEVLAGGEITQGADIFRAVSEGRLQMGNGWPNWWSGQNPAWAVMNAGPFDFMNLDASMMFFLTGPGIKMANEIANPQGILWRPAWWAGMEFGLLSKQPIRSLADLKNKKIRIGPGFPAEVFSEAAKSFAVPLVPEEIKAALEQGSLDAVEWTTTAGAWNLGLQTSSPYAIVPAIWQPSVLADFLINQKAYDQLDSALQTILEVAIKSYTLETTLKSKKADFEALKKFRKSKTEINRWSEEDIEKWRIATKIINHKYAESNLFTKKLLHEKESFKKEFNEYYELFGPYE